MSRTLLLLILAACQPDDGTSETSPAGDAPTDEPSETATDVPEPTEPSEPTEPTETEPTDPVLKRAPVGFQRLGSLEGDQLPPIITNATATCGEGVVEFVVGFIGTVDDVTVIPAAGGEPVPLEVTADEMFRRAEALAPVDLDCEEASWLFVVEGAGRRRCRSVGPEGEAAAAADGCEVL